MESEIIVYKDIIQYNSYCIVLHIKQTVLYVGVIFYVLIQKPNDCNKSIFLRTS